jgi:hypothetical protein
MATRSGKEKARLRVQEFSLNAPGQRPLSRRRREQAHAGQQKGAHNIWPVRGLLGLMQFHLSGSFNET